MISEARSSAGMAEWEAANELGYIGYVEEPTEEPVPEPEPVDEQEY
jgi:hypothetical protein